MLKKRCFTTDLIKQNESHVTPGPTGVLDNGCKEEMSLAHNHVDMTLVTKF